MGLFKTLLLTTASLFIVSCESESLTSENFLELDETKTSAKNLNTGRLMDLSQLDGSSWQVSTLSVNRGTQQPIDQIDFDDIFFPATVNNAQDFSSISFNNNSISLFNGANLTNTFTVSNRVRNGNPIRGIFNIDLGNLSTTTPRVTIRVNRNQQLIITQLSNRNNQVLYLMDRITTEISNTSTNAVSLASNGCSNVIILDGHAYAACGGEIEVIALDSRERRLIGIPADDITVDRSTGTIFIQSRNSISSLNTSNPLQPRVAATTTTNFGLFSGISAANGIVVTSGGTANTRIFTYTPNSIRTATNGIGIVDQRTGSPDVNVISTTNGARAFYSQDLGGVRNWGIQIVDFNTNGTVTVTPEVATLSPGPLTGGFNLFTPANFPVESEFLNNRLYIAHFASNSVEVINTNNRNILPSIDLGFTPVNITTDGTSLFVIGLDSDTVRRINPVNNNISNIDIDNLVQPRGIAVTNQYIVIADRSEGLILFER